MNHYFSIHSQSCDAGETAHEEGSRKNSKITLSNPATSNGNYKTFTNNELESETTKGTFNCSFRTLYKTE